MAYCGLIGAVLYAKDLGRLVEFYSSVAGIEPQAFEEGFAVLGHKPSQFLIVRMPKRIAETIDIIAPPEPREVRQLSSCSVSKTSHMRETVRQSSVAP